MAESVTEFLRWLVAIKSWSFWGASDKKEQKQERDETMLKQRHVSRFQCFD